jgi:hypothetical protein
MNAKIAEVDIHVNGVVERFSKWEADHDDMLSGGHLGAQMHRFRRLWRVFFFLDREHFDRLTSESPQLLELLRQAIDQLALGHTLHGSSPEASARCLADTASRIPGTPLYQHVIQDVRIGARADATAGVVVRYPSGGYSLKMFDGGAVGGKQS